MVKKHFKKDTIGVLLLVVITLFAGYMGCTKRFNEANTNKVKSETKQYDNYSYYDDDYDDYYYDDEYYYDDLIGLIAYGEDDQLIGEVVDLRELPRGILLEIKIFMRVLVC